MRCRLSPMGPPRAGAHEVKRDQPVELLCRVRVTEAETERTGCSRLASLRNLSVLDRSPAPPLRGHPGSVNMRGLLQYID
jgi:hypothetical protein